MSAGCKTHDNHEPSQVKTPPKVAALQHKAKDFSRLSAARLSLKLACQRPRKEFMFAEAQDTSQAV